MAYHLRWSSEWTIRLGDGTEESAKRTQAAAHQLIPYVGELTEADALENWANTEGVGVEFCLHENGINRLILYISDSR